MIPARKPKAVKGRTKAEPSAKVAAAPQALAAAQRKAALAAFLQGLADADIPIAQWARDKGFDLQDVYHVTNGRTVGARGKARAVLRAMGIAVPGCPATSDQAAA